MLTIVVSAYDNGEVHAHDGSEQSRWLRHAHPPPALLDLLSLRVGTKVDIGVERGRLVVETGKRPSYSLNELLAQCEKTDAPSIEDLAWLDAGPVGNEPLQKSEAKSGSSVPAIG